VPYTPPTGRIRSNSRRFEDVVRDLRYAVFAIARFRPLADGRFQGWGSSIGSGFFVSHSVFVTCYHVINPSNLPHVDGDIYQLICNQTGPTGITLTVAPAVVGQNLFLYADADLAILKTEGTPHQPFVALDYGESRPGREIGVAGYPLGRIIAENDQPRFDAQIFRVAKGVITSSYTTNLRSEYVTVNQTPVIEVNFMFVPGNSGGPVFDAGTGQVLGYVHGFTATKIRERLETVTMIPNPPEGTPNTYIENLNALYSLAIKIDTAKPHIESHGAAL
jgi:S1-C subfamily serine protease